MAVIARGPSFSISSNRYELRSMDRSGSAPLQRWMADPRVSEGMARAPRRLSESSAAAYIDSFDNRRSFLLGIHDRSDDRLIGFYTMHIDPQHLTATVSLVVGEPDALDQAVAAETARTLADWAFERGGLYKLIAIVVESNTLVADWLGKRMQLEGRLRDELLSEDKTTRLTVLRFGLLRPDWAGVRERSLKRQAERGF